MLWRVNSFCRSTTAFFLSAFCQSLFYIAIFCADRWIWMMSLLIAMFSLPPGCWCSHTNIMPRKAHTGPAIPLSFDLLWGNGINSMTSLWNPVECTLTCFAVHPTIPSLAKWHTSLLCKFSSNAARSSPCSVGLPLPSWVTAPTLLPLGTKMWDLLRRHLATTFILEIQAPIYLLLYTGRTTSLLIIIVVVITWKGVNTNRKIYWYMCAEVACWTWDL